MIEERLLDENKTFSGLLEEDIQFLKRRLGGRLQLRSGGWAITRVVGHIITPSGLILRIRSPKSSASNLLAWLCYADPHLRAMKLESIQPRSSADGDLVSVLIRLFLRDLLRTIDQNGLTHAYLRSLTRGATVHGTIDFTRLLSEGHNLSRIPCSVWTRAPDTPLNRVLAAALQRIAVDPALYTIAAAPLHIALGYFDQVSTSGVEADLHSGKPLARNEDAFRTAYEFARIILSLGGLSDGAVHNGFLFLIDLERLFETAVQRAFSDAPNIACNPQAQVHYHRVSGEKRKRIAMRIDALCQTPDGGLVVDAKFKHDVSAANIHQIIAYCYLTGIRRAALVVPGSPGDDSEISISPEATTGNPRLDIRVLHFDTSHSNLLGWRTAAMDLVGRAIQA